MAEIIRMPKLSDTMTEGVVASWNKKVGDTVKRGDILAEIETDKATMEFESFFNGTLLYIGLEKGQSAPVDSILAIIGEKGEDVKAILEKEKSAAPKKESSPVKASADKEEKVEKKQTAAAEKKSEPVKQTSQPVTIQHEENRSEERRV